MKRVFYALATLILTIVPMDNSRADYCFTPIDPPGSNHGNTQPRAINDCGQIVGYFTDRKSRHGFLFSNGKYTILDVPGSRFTQAMGINNFGQIVGYYIPPGALPRAFILTDGKYTFFDVPGSFQTRATGINDAGQIVGYYDQGGNWHGFLLSDGKFTTFDFPGSEMQTFPFSINSSEQIVAITYFRRGPPEWTNQAFLLSDWKFSMINVPDSQDTTAGGINDAGEIVGTYHPFREHGYLLSDGEITTIDVPGADGTRAFGINNLGQIVGESIVAGPSGTYTSVGFLATPK
jgi:probable HAF family extracellular repeat protein